MRLYSIKVSNSSTIESLFKKSFGNEFKFSISSAARPIVASGLVEPCTLHRSQKQLQVTGHSNNCIATALFT